MRVLDLGGHIHSATCAPSVVTRTKFQKITTAKTSCQAKRARKNEMPRNEVFGGEGDIRRLRRCAPTHRHSSLRRRHSRVPPKRRSDTCLGRSAQARCGDGVASFFFVGEGFASFSFEFCFLVDARSVFLSRCVVAVGHLQNSAPRRVHPMPIHTPAGPSISRAPKHTRHPNPNPNPP
jgi:hypothetical protein